MVVVVRLLVRLVPAFGGLRSARVSEAPPDFIDFKVLMAQHLSPPLHSIEVENPRSGDVNGS